MAGGKHALSYERTIYIFLSLYRFFSYVLAVVLIQARVVGTAAEPDFRMYALLILLGLYTLLKSFATVRWKQKDPLTYVVVGGDLALCLAVLMMTGGLNSGLLLYALTPIITVALLLEERTAQAMAAVSSILLLLAHTVLAYWTHSFVWIMEGNYFPLLIVYIGFSFMVASLPSRTNLNIRRRIEMGAVLEERKRIRRELHDGVVQALSYLNLKTKHLSNTMPTLSPERLATELEDIEAVVKDAYDDVRQSIDSLADKRPAPLAPALTEYVQEFGARNKIEAQFDSSGDIPPLSSAAESHLLRICHEALNNVRKHAGASRVQIRLAGLPECVEMTIKDNGNGFKQERSQADGRKRHGLDIMKERAEALGGVFQIASDVGRGTEVSVRIPAERMSV